MRAIQISQQRALLILLPVTKRLPSNKGTRESFFQVAFNQFHNFPIEPRILSHFKNKCHLNVLLNTRKYEPLSYLLGKEYFLHAYGPIYALSADVVVNLAALRNNSFRMFSNEDVTIGSWMLAMNMDHEDSKELCSAACTASSIAVWDIPKCSGLCNPEKKMLELHKLDICSKSSTLPSEEEDD